MSRKLILGVFIVGIFAMTVAFLVPGLYESTRQDSMETFELTEGERTTITDNLEANATTINTATPNHTANVTVNLTDVEDYSDNSTTIDEGNSSTIDVNGEPVTITVQQVRTQDRAYVSFEYPTLYGWAEGPRGLMTNVGMVIILLGGGMIMGLAAKVVL